MIVPPAPDALAESLSGPSFNPWMTMIAVAILVPVSYWVYNDAKIRYNSFAFPLLWAVLVFAALIIFLPLYLLLRPAKRGNSAP